MRKTSHDGGDSTSITSGVENEIKKSAMKPKKSSLKRKAPNFSQESDDTVIEPLLQRDKEKTEPQSAKYFGKGKTESLLNKESDNKAKTTTTTGFCGTTESLLSFKDPESTKLSSGVVAPLHNYMNTNVFNTHDAAEANVSTKSQIIVEIDSSKQTSYAPSPLIFTTAKIHSDAKTNQMEPVHVTPVPILSTIEVSISKRGTISTNEKKISNGSSVINPVYSPMPLNKGKEENVIVSSFSTVISPTINKDALDKTVSVTSTTKLANITSSQSSSMKITLPSTTSNSLLKSKAKDKQGDTKDVKKEQILPQNIQLQSKAFNVGSTKNNATVKTMIASSGKAIDILTTSAQTNQCDKSQIQKLDAGDMPVNVSSTDSYLLVSNNKTPTSQSSVGICIPTKNVSSSVNNKQLQRQKTTSEEISNIKSKVEPYIEHSENLSAKTPTSSHSKKINSISIKDGKLPNVGVNIMQSINTKMSINNTAIPISKTTPISTTTNHTVTSIASSNTMTASSETASKPPTTNTISNVGKIVSPNATSTNELYNVNNKVSTASRESSIITESPADEVAKTSIPKSIVTAKCPEVTSMQQQKYISKTLRDKTPMINTSAANTTVSVSSDKNKPTSVTTVKPSSAVAKTTTTTFIQPQANSTNTNFKTPYVTTSVKTTSMSTITSATTKPSSSNSQVSSSTPLLTLGSVTAVKAPAVTKSIPQAMSGPVGSITTVSPNITSPQGSVNKQAITAVGISTTSKTPPAVAFGKLSTVNSSTPASQAIADVKSPNNNSSQTFGASKPSMILIPKTESVTAVSKISAGSSSINTTAPAAKSPKGTSSVTKNIKDSAASVTKPTKISVATNSPPATTANKLTVGTTTKVSSTVAPSAPTSVTKKVDGTVLAKTGSVTTSTKPLVSTLTKATVVTPLSSTTTSAVAIKPTSISAKTQESANKSAGLAESSVPLSTPVLRLSESDKKGGSKSSENNKDGKGS